MIRNGLGVIARTVIPATMLLFLGASAGNAAGLSPAASLERAVTTANGEIVHQAGEGNQLQLEGQIRRMDRQAGRSGSGYRRDGRSYRRFGGYSRDGRRHRRYGRRHRDGVFFGFYPFTLNDYAPYAYAHPRRYSSGGCSYWSRRCAANWGYRNSSYYGCMRYHGC